MFDTVLLCLTRADVSGANFLEVVPRFWWVLSVAPLVRCGAGSLNVAGGLYDILFPVEEVFSRECVIFAVPKC